MAKHVYLMEEDGTGTRHNVYPITDINAIIGLNDSNGDLLSKIKEIDDRLTALEKKVNYH